MFHRNPLVGPNDRPLCIAVYADSLRDKFAPFEYDDAAVAEEASKAVLEGAEIGLVGLASQHAASRLLVKPLASSIVRGLLGKAELAGKAGTALSLFIADAKLADSLNDVIEARRNGGCYASFR